MQQAAASLCLCQGRRTQPGRTAPRPCPPPGAGLWAGVTTEDSALLLSEAGRVLPDSAQVSHDQEARSALPRGNTVWLLSTRHTSHASSVRHGPVCGMCSLSCCKLCSCPCEGCASLGRFARLARAAPEESVTTEKRRGEEANCTGDFLWELRDE